MGVWKKIQLGEVCSIRRGSSPRPIKDYLATSGMPWVKISDATESNTRYINSTAQFIKFNGVNRSVIVNPGSLILSNSGTAALPKFMNIQACIHDGWQVFENCNGIDKFFLYYLLLHIRSRLLHGAYDSTMKNLTLDMVRNVEISLPPLPTQRRIAAILSSLDDKIENNRRICEKLEEMAQAIFKQWFVDFNFPDENGEPYKDNGGEMVESELGLIPKGWGVGTLDDVGTIVGGSTPSKKREDFYEKGTIPWITPRDLSSYDGLFIDKGELSITQKGYESCSTKLLEKGSILFTSRAPIGYIAIASKDVCTNQGFKSIVPNKGYGSEFVFELLKQLTPTIINSGSGSTFKEISGSGMKSIPTILPSIKLVVKFCKSSKACFQTISSKEVETKNLRITRDTLLPRLMSGELSVERDRDV